MKKLLIVFLFLFLIELPSMAKSKNVDKHLKLGISLSDVEKFFGKPSIKTIDSSYKQTWIYFDKFNMIPSYNCSDFGKDFGYTTVILKFDDYQNLTNISYQKYNYREKK